MATDNATHGSRGFTLVEVLVAVVILAIGILAVSQMTVMGMRTTVVIRDYQQAREAVAMGLETLKLLEIDHALLTGNCADSTQLDSILPSTYQADSTNLVGQTLGILPFDIYWNICEDYPLTDVRTIRMFILKNGRRLASADFVKWR
jgi:prepilin-type N-terminal cleavage/methylation domain-containing protein